MDTDKDFLKNLTAETQRKEVFAQSGDGDWTKKPVFERVSSIEGRLRGE